MANLDTIGGLHYEMMKRCYNEKSVMYSCYGAKGIKVCEEWHDRDVFKKWCLENGYKNGFRLDRIDSFKDYCPTNCFLGKKNCKINGGKSQTTKEKIKYRKQKKKECGIIGKVTDDELYVIYRSMINRCETKSHPSYNNYGGRGIFVCKDWKGNEGFFNFKKWANENDWVKGLSLDRIDNNKGYSPDNCRWVTKSQQSYNKRNNILYSYLGVDMPLGMIAKLENVKYGMLYNRVKIKGMNIEKALVDIKNRM